MGNKCSDNIQNVLSFKSFERHLDYVLSKSKRGRLYRYFKRKEIL